jgi:hypothetical protein
VENKTEWSKVKNMFTLKNLKKLVFVAILVNAGGFCLYCAEN